MTQCPDFYHLDARPLIDRRGFTLIELMISISIVLVLLVGVNQVFTYTAKAIGTGNAVNDAIRDSRAAQTTFANDLGDAATTDGGFFVIHSAQVYAFQDRADYASDQDQEAATYTVTTPDDTTIHPATYNFRNHRVDVLNFFARGSFNDKTGNASYTLPAVSSNEACIWYGFTKQPDSTYLNPNDTGYQSSTGADPTFRDPGISSSSGTFPTNTAPTSAKKDTLALDPNNFFASDWVLGRVSTLLAPNAPAITSLFYSYTSGGGMWSSSNQSLKMIPLGYAQNVVATDSNSAVWETNAARCDIAQTSISNYSAQLASFIGDTADNPSAQTWWNNLFVGTFGSASGQLYQCNSYVNSTTLPLTTPAEVTAYQNTLPARIARTTPFFLKGCTQFIVEYAGDFVQQDDNPASLTYGDVLDAVTTSNGKADGIDYELVPQGAVARNLWPKRIRWYGLPRNTSGTVAIPGNNTAAYSAATKTFNIGTTLDQTALTDVVPLRDVICTKATAITTLQNALGASYIANTPAPAWPERYIPAAALDYSGTGMTNGVDYLTAWGPDSDAAGIPRPKMIRITMTLQDPGGHLANGQTYQYVYTLP